ncbi:MAG: DUF305 domain-containing protein [Granulosicoccus sp.]|nr:DUF305 domain-containing protein [Granulosicoccus sp.]
MNRRQFIVAGGLVSASCLSTDLSAQVPATADIGYLQDMTVHHLQALSMCRRVLGRDTGDAVQGAAAEVLENQAMEVGQMRAWLADWGASTVPVTTVMAWMGANQGAGMPITMMPGYASDEELLELSTLTGWDRGRRWLELMRAHHIGGVAMAEQASILASSAKVVTLANLQVAAQNYEISQYDFLLAGVYQ